MREDQNTTSNQDLTDEQRGGGAAADSAEEQRRRARAEGGLPGGGQGRRDIIEKPTGVHPASAGIDPERNAEIRTEASWGQGKRGAAGYNDAGGSELTMRDGQLLGGLTAGPGGEPTIDIHGGDVPPDQKRAGQRGEPPPADERR